MSFCTWSGWDPATMAQAFQGPPVQQVARGHREIAAGSRPRPDSWPANAVKAGEIPCLEQTDNFFSAIDAAWSSNYAVTLSSVAAEVPASTQAVLADSALKGDIVFRDAAFRRSETAAPALAPDCLGPGPPSICIFSAMMSVV